MGAGDLVNNYSIAANPYTKLGVAAANEQDTQRLKDERDAALKKFLQTQAGEQALKQISAKGQADVDTEAGKQAVSIGNIPKVQAMAPGESSIKVGEISTGADPYAKAKTGEANRISMQTSRLSKEAKGLEPLSHQMETLNLYHQMLDDPNKFDQKKLQVLGARLVEGNGQRLLDSVIQQMGGNKESLAGDVQSKLNYVLGRAKAGLPQDQANAMRDTAFKYQDEMMPQWEAAVQKFKAYAPSIAPEVPNVGGLVDASLGEGSRLQQALNDRRQKWDVAQQAKAQMPAQGFAQGGPSQGAPASIADKLTNWLKGKAAASSPVQQQQAPQGGTIRVKHIGSGQTGTIPASEFDPSIYQQVQ